MASPSTRDDRLWLSREARRAHHTSMVMRSAEQQEYGTGEGAGPAEQDLYPQQPVTIHGPL